jgi:hypothetical protein
MRWESRPDSSEIQGQARKLNVLDERIAVYINS